MPSSSFGSEAVLRTAFDSISAGTLAQELFSGEPWIFGEDKYVLSDLQEHMRRELKDRAATLYVAGSAATGFSLSPVKFGRPFSRNSDLDLVVVSPRLFDRSWRAVRRWAHPRRGGLPTREADWLRKRVDEVFWGWSVPNEVVLESRLKQPQRLTELRNLNYLWTAALRSVSAEFAGAEVAKHTAKARLYRSVNAAYDYHADSLRRVKKTLQTSG